MPAAPITPNSKNTKTKKKTTKKASQAQLDDAMNHPPKYSKQKRTSDATSSTTTSEESASNNNNNNTKNEHSLTRRSLADRARVFDKSYVDSPQKKSQNKMKEKDDDKNSNKNNRLQDLLDASLHRKEANVIHGRKKTHRSPSNPGNAATILNTPLHDAAELQALMDASDHRKRGTHITDGAKAVYHPTAAPNNDTKSKNTFSIIPRNSNGAGAKPKPLAKGPRLQKLLDASEHKKLLQTSSAHRLAHRMLMLQGSSQHSSRHAGFPAFTFNLRQVKNRIKPALPQGVEPLKPTETTFPNVQAPKLKVDIPTFTAPKYRKTKSQERLLKSAMQSQTYVLKRHTAHATTSRTLLEAMEPVEFRKGEIVQRQGENRPEDDQLYIVGEGHVQVKVDGKVVDTLRKGQTFGQERLLLRQSNHATIQSGSNQTKLFRLDQTTFRVILQQQYQSVVLEELKAKTPKTYASTTWNADDIYNKKQGHSHAAAADDDDSEMSCYSEDLEDGKDDRWGHRPARPRQAGHRSYDDDDDDTNDDTNDYDSFMAESLSVDASFLQEDKIVSTTTSRKSGSSAAKKALVPTSTTKTTKAKAKQTKSSHSAILNFEKSPVFQQQQALRRSVGKHASAKDDLEFIKVLGEGQFGEVWLVAATLPDQNPKRQEFALKIQKLEGDDGGDEDAEEAKEAIRNEIKVLTNLHHPFIVNLVHTYESEDSMDMLLGLIPGGELWDKIHREEADGNWVSGISEGWARFYAYVLTDTLGFMHSRGYIFRDLKPENIMLDADGYPIIVDFGFAKYLQPQTGEKTFTFCGTPNYVAPEIISNEGHAKEVDFWALGVVIYEMVSGENPFFYDGMEQSALYQAITEEDPYEMSDSVTASDQVRELTDLLFLKDPAERLGSHGAQEILEHAWFHGMPPLSEIHAKRVDPQKVSELSLDEIMQDEQSLMDDEEDHGSFADMDEKGHMSGVQEQDDEEDESEPMRSSPIRVELPRGFSTSRKSNSFEDSRPSKDVSVKSPRRHSVDNVILIDDDDEIAEAEGATSPTTMTMSPTTPTYNPTSPGTIKYWTPRKKGLGYFVNMKSPEEKRSSKSRRSVVNNFLSQYLEDVGLDDDDGDAEEKKMGTAESQFNKSCPLLR